MRIFRDGHKAGRLPLKWCLTDRLWTRTGAGNQEGRHAIQPTTDEYNETAPATRTIEEECCEEAL
jgi:hypothetical protein